MMKWLGALFVYAALTAAAAAQLITASPSGSGSAALVLISQQIASGAATIQWTGLGSTYNNYQLVCSGIIPATNGQKIFLQFGEGGTPTWETANYRYASTIVGSGATPTVAAGSSAGTDSGIDITGGGQPGPLAAQSSQLTMRLYNIPSTTYYATVDFSYSIYSNTGPTYYSTYAGGNYAADTTAKTAIRLIAGSGNITGTCTLWGLVPS